MYNRIIKRIIIYKSENILIVSFYQRKVATRLFSRYFRYYFFVISKDKKQFLIKWYQKLLIVILKSNIIQANSFLLLSQCFLNAIFVSKLYPSRLVFLFLHLEQLLSLTIDHSILGQAHNQAGLL